MIDCNLPDLSLQGGAQAAPQSSAKTSGRSDDNTQDFSKFVENKNAAGDELREAETDEISATREEKVKDPIDTKWMSHLLHLTQMAQESNPEELSTDAFLTPLIEEAETENFELNLKALPSANQDKNAISVTAGKMSVHKEATPSADDDETKSSLKANAKQNMAKLESALRAQNAPADVDKGKSATSSTQPTPILIKSASSSGNEPAPAPQNQPARQDFSYLVMPQQKATGNLEIGDKIALKNMAAPIEMHTGSTVSAIEGVDIIRARKQGDLTSLQLQLTPENLGIVEARLRLDKDHLMVELSAAKPETAKLLAKDQHLLVQTLEKAGFGGDTRLNISIIERASANLQPATVLATSQTSSQTMSGNHEGGQNGREYMEADSGASSSRGQDKNHQEGQEDNNHQNLGYHIKKSSLERPHHAFGSSRRLVV